jgi:hypothetical protein
MELQELVDFLKKNKIRKYKDSSFDLEFSEEAFRSDNENHQTFYSPAKLPEHQSLIPTEPVLTEEQFLYWSSGFETEETKSSPPKPEEAKS